MCALIVSLFAHMAATVVQIPTMDMHGRVPTLNQHGFSDPATNEIVDEYLAWGVEKAGPSPTPALYRSQGYLLEIGGGFGFLAQRAVEQGIYYLFNDMDERHVEIAKASLNPDAPGFPHFETYTGRFPALDSNDLGYLRTRTIRGVGGFMMLHFLTAAEIETLFAAVWDLLEPGGRAFFVAATPYNKAFMKFHEEYAERKKKFLKKPGTTRFPGEIDDAWAYLSPDHYPRFFHALDGDTLSYLAQKNTEKPFRVLRVANIQRPNPPEQAYRRGYRFGKTELVGIVLEKPKWR